MLCIFTFLSFVFSCAHPLFRHESRLHHSFFLFYFVFHLYLIIWFFLLLIFIFPLNMFLTTPKFLNYIRSTHLCTVATSPLALNVRFIMNGMCPKNSTQIYVAGASNNRVIVVCAVPYQSNSGPLHTAYKGPLMIYKKYFDVMLHLGDEWPSKLNILIADTILAEPDP